MKVLISVYTVCFVALLAITVQVTVELHTRCAATESAIEDLKEIEK